MPSALKPGDRATTFVMNAELEKRLKAFMREQEFRQRSQAIRVLVSRALKAEGK